MADEIIIERVELSPVTVRIGGPFQMLISVSGGSNAVPFEFPFENRGLDPTIVFIVEEV